MTTMNALDVACATCLAVPGDARTTHCSKRAVSPHTARLRLARAVVACPRCSAAERQPCLTPAGEAQTRLHAARNHAAWQQSRKTR